MNPQIAFRAQSEHVVPRVVDADSRRSRNHPGLRASLGFAALLLGSAPALAQTYLGTAQPFAVLAASAVTCPTVATVTGDLGISPNGAASITGFPAPCTVVGTTHAADAVAAQAQTDLVTAYNFLASQACNLDLTGQDLGTVGTLTPGVYCFSSSAQLTGTLTLDALGNPNAVFIFKTGSTLTTASNAIVSVINGGSDCGVSWQIGSTATLGTATAFRGNIVALTSATTNTGATVSGRLLARNGAVTVAGNVSSAVCSAFVGTGLPGPGSGVPAAAGIGIPTLSEWAMIMLAALLAIAGFAAMRRQAR